MLRKNLLFSILAVVAIICGCAREIEPEGSQTPASKYLVIKADCSSMTKTDINEGKSTWEAGDKITVLYNGDAYEYVAGTPSQDGKQTYFTSSAGITSYDGTALVAYYQALSAEDGTVGIAAERDIAFQKEGQVNSACAPLVGTTSAETMEDGVLNMYFQNIFSVVELRIDAAGYHVNSPARTLKVEPADGSDFSGYLTCSATVDASTLALETSSTGNSLTLNLPEGTDLRKAQILKFPVGRFTSSKGLKLTLTLEDGTVYQKNVYKTGLSTYVENNGRYAVQHLARAIFPFSGGISTAGDLVDFATAVNSGTSLLKYMNDEGKVVLLDDIDMSGVTSWTPIGNGTFTGIMSGLTGNNVCSYTGSSFKGEFDGQGFSIRNLKLSKDLTAEGAVYGLFGIIEGAVVENVVLGAPENDDSSFEFSADAATDAGVLVGVCYGSVIRNCTNYIPMNVKGNSVSGKRTTMGAFAGFVYNAETGSVLENLINYGAVSGQRDKSTGGATSVMAGGIAGASNGSGTYGRNTIRGCVNYGDMKVDIERVSGIVATTNHLTDLIACMNYGNQTNSYNNTRVGMITSMLNGNSTITDCENHGDAIMTAPQVSGKYSRVGGLVGLMNSSQVSLTGGGNYGKIVSDCTNGRGLLVAWFSDLKSMSGVVAGGSMYSYNGGEHQQIGINSSNYMTYIGSSQDAADKAKISNIIYIDPDAAGIRTVDELLEFALLVNAGGDYSKFCQDGVVLLLADINMSRLASWVPIGTEANPWNGKFSGQGFSIKNIRFTTDVTSQTYTGIFGVVAGGSVANLRVGTEGDKWIITGAASAGTAIAPVVALAEGGAEITACTNNLDIDFRATNDNGALMMLSGIVSRSTGATITGCVNNGDIVITEIPNRNNNQSNSVNMGGICGYAEADAATDITSCVNNGHIVCPTGRGGGICGSFLNGAMTASTNNGLVEDGTQYASDPDSHSYKYMGGLAGATAAASVIDGCTNLGNVITHQSCRTGGFVGYNARGTVKNCTNGVISDLSKGNIIGDVITDAAGNLYGPGWACGYTSSAIKGCFGYGRMATYAQRNNLDGDDVDIPLHDNAVAHGMSYYDFNNNQVNWTHRKYYSWDVKETIQLHAGVKYQAVEWTRGLTRKMKIVEIDLTNPDIEITTAMANDIIPNPNGNNNSNNGKKTRETLSEICARKRSEGKNIIMGMNSGFFDSNDGFPRGIHIQEGVPLYVNNADVRNRLVNHRWGFAQFTDKTARCDVKEFKGYYKVAGNEYEYYSINDTICRHSDATLVSNVYTSHYKKKPHSTLSLTNPLSTKALYVVAEFTDNYLTVNTGYVKARVINILDGRSSEIAASDLPYLTGSKQFGIQITGNVADRVMADVRVGDEIEIRADVTIGGSINKPIYTMNSSMYQFLVDGVDKSTSGLSATNSNLTTYDPVSFVGVDQTGTKVWFVQVDGRSSASLGMKSPEMAHTIKYLGGYNMTRFDGGGSSAMWIYSGSSGRIVNTPSDSRGERSGMNYIMVNVK